MLQELKNVFRVSLRSKSPEDSISLLSESAGSIDSMLNHSSREEDEIKALMDGDEFLFDNPTCDIYGKFYQEFNVYVYYELFYI